MDNIATTVMTGKDLPYLVAPHLPRSSISYKFCGGEYLPYIIPNNEYVLKDNGDITTALSSETCAASTIV